jgi:hypothetical protein
MKMVAIATVALALTCAVAGCSTQPTATTASVGVVAGPTAEAPLAVATPESRLKLLAWNSVWAEVCGFTLDTAKLKASYLSYETAAGATPEAIAKLASSFDRARGIIRPAMAGRSDQCTADRIERIRTTVARYLANDFAPGGAV